MQDWQMATMIRTWQDNTRVVLRERQIVKRCLLSLRHRTVAVSFFKWCTWHDSQKLAKRILMVSALIHIDYICFDHEEIILLNEYQKQIYQSGVCTSSNLTMHDVCMQGAIVKMRHACLTKTFTQWRLNTEFRIEMKNLMGTAISKWQKSTIDATWKAWLLLSRQNNIVRLSKLDLAIHTLSKRRMVKAWLAWRSRQVYQRSLHATMTQAILKLKHGSKIMCFNAWKQKARQMAILKFRVLQALKMNKTAFCFWGWASQVKRETNLRVNLKAILYKMLKERFMQSFYRWCTNANILAHQRRTVSLAVARLKHQVCFFLQKENFYTVIQGGACFYKQAFIQIFLKATCIKL